MTVSDTPNANQWLDAYGDYLYRYALLRVRDESVAEDLVQETLLAAWRGYASFAGRGAERTWLTGILKHKIIDHFRRSVRETQLDPVAEERLENEDLFRTEGEWAGHWNKDLGPTDWGTNPASVLEQREFWQTLQNCISHLPQRTAAVFTLREMEEHTSEDICRMLEISPNNLWVILHRARMQLRRCLETRWFRV